MAHISTPTIDLSAGDGPAIRRVGDADRRKALAVLLTGRADSKQSAVDHFLNFARQQQMSFDGLWAVYDGQTPVYSTLIIPGAGRTAVMFIAPVRHDQAIDLAARLYQAVVEDQSPKQTRLIQVLLEPVQTREEQALLQAGFMRLASLSYLRRSCLGEVPISDKAGESHGGGFDSIALADKPLTRYPWSGEHYEYFARAIDASYEGTLDCPGLVGIREIDDIIAGHRAVGRFEPTLWSAYYDDNEPAAVLLLNPLADRRELELVYLGLSPAYRGKGLATKLMRVALAQARRLQYTGIHLAVDQNNVSAVKLYKSLGFRVTGRKTAMIGVLKPSM